MPVLLRLVFIFMRDQQIVLAFTWKSKTILNVCSVIGVWTYSDSPIRCDWVVKFYLLVDRYFYLVIKTKYDRCRMPKLYEIF